LSIITTNRQPNEPTPLFLREQNRELALDAVDDDPADQRETGDEETLLCGNCLLAITSEKEAIAVDGAHHHTFFNPAGIVYEIRCFKKAFGCFIQGEPSTQFTWFKGHAWQYDLCARCRRHLGWHFLGRYGSFHGLIAKHLTASR